MKNKLFERMLEASTARNLPVSNKEAIQKDFLDILSYTNKLFIWVLHSAGTELFPIGIGKEPSGVMSQIYALAKQGRRVEVIYIDTDTGLLEKITSENAEKYFFQLPECDFRSIEDIVFRVRSVINEGKENNLWAVRLLPAPDYSQDEWPEWLCFFNHTKNSVMQTFMRKAIDAAQLNILRSLKAA